MKKKIAILIADSIYNRKGMMNAELNRISHLLKIATYDIDVYAFQTYSGWLVRTIRGTKKIERPKRVKIDGIDINVIWNSFSLIDYYMTVKFHKQPLVNRDWELKYVPDFKDYDLIVTNSTDLGFLAYKVKEKYNIPYFVTWHGTDIHTAPFNNPSRMRKTKTVLEGADMNYMVSKALLETSKKISASAKTMVLYNGVSALFQRYDDSDRIIIRKEKGVEGKKVVAFAGHLIEVKNPQLFPEIFKAVNDKYKSPVEFWIMGSGKMGDYVNSKCSEYNVPLKMWGNIPAGNMPTMLNCVDVLILPSRNEGLPLIAVEAIACGANAVGAKVGGIPEAMGDENSFEHGGTFVENISNRIVYMLNNEVYQPLLPCFSWAETARIENKIYTDYFATH